MKGKKILFIINDFNVGGAELFIYRLAIALQSKGYNIYILELFNEKSDVNFKCKFENEGIIVINRKLEISKFKIRLYWILNAIFFKIGIKGIFSKIINKKNELYLSKLLDIYNIDIIHSHYYSSDVFSQSLKSKKKIRRIVTFHGDYNLNVFNKFNLSTQEEFIKNTELIINNVDAVTYVADVNIELLDKYKITPNNLFKIPLGYQKNISNTTIDNVSETITFCMVARSNLTKGWENLIQVFDDLNVLFPNIKLICVCPIDESYQKIIDKYPNANIMYTDYSSNPSEYICKSDVCILPTYFDGESSPYSIIEYLAHNKAIIASDAGEIRGMLTTDVGLSGIIIDHNKLAKGINNELFEAMKLLIENPNLIYQYSTRSNLAFNKFSMENCLEAFINLYEK